MAGSNLIYFAGVQLYARVSLQTHMKAKHDHHRNNFRSQINVACGRFRQGHLTGINMVSRTPNDFVNL
jgi:hypothetical protein